jgi:hypothetical protein
MNQAEVQHFITQLEHVQHESNYGYQFYFVGDDHMRPFVTLADSDNDYDSVSNLSREGVFRVNIGVSRQTFESLFAGSADAAVDYTALNVFLPHPEYARQHFICILNPAGENANRIQQFITEAHQIATTRMQRRKQAD